MLRVYPVVNKGGSDHTKTVVELGGWPLIGRAEELDVVAGAIGKSSASAGVVIFGDLGVGKSRLAHDAVSRCEGAVVHWAAGSSAARAIPLGAFVNWLPADIGEPVQAAGRVVNELMRGAGPRPCIVAVDDAHLLDDTSAFMLQQLVDRRLARLILAVCSGAAVSDPVSALWRDSPVQRLDLQPLGRADCLTLLESVLGGSVDPVSERRLVSLTRGNVSFLRRIVEQEMCAGRLRHTDGTWTWLPGAVVPSSVCELIEHQIGQLSDAVADTVDLLSVAEPLTLRMLVDIAGCEPVEQAEKRGLIIVDGRDQPVVRLAHPLYGEVRRLRAGHIRLRRLRGTVAARLDPHGDACHILRRGTLQLESDIAATAQDMLRAGEAALWSGDAGLALRFAQAAAAAGGGWRASLACAEAHTMAGELDEAETVLVADDSPRDACLQVALGHATNLYLQGRTDDARAVLQSAHSDPAETVGALSAMRAFLDLCGGDFAGATTAADAALRCNGVEDFSAMLAATVKTIAVGEIGRADELASTSAFAHALGAGSPSTRLLRFALAEAHSSALQLLGSPGAVDAVDSVRDDDQPPDVYRWVAMMAGSANLSRGRVDLAVRQLRDALSAHRPAFLGGWLCRYHVDLAIALAVRGEADAAVRCLRKLASARRPEMVWLEPMEMLATAWISAATGAVTRAIGEARSAAVTAASRGQPAREVLCLQTATSFGDTTTVARLGELVRVVGGARAPVAAQHAAALAAGDGDGLMSASAAYEEIGDLLAAVDAAAQASIALRHTNRRGSALGATNRARELAGRCGDVHTPALSDAAAPAVFTGRMREVVMLAGGGLTNREIAQRLQLSVRTVEGHLYRAASRVGARDRNELARAIGHALATPA
jgi:DNA-binding CsgD family transcriptional regulator/tetratricopeptide (TPR) repeat protein